MAWIAPANPNAAEEGSSVRSQMPNAYHHAPVAGLLMLALAAPGAQAQGARAQPLDAYEAAQGADVLAVVTEWDEFRNVDLARVASVMAKPRIVDARNVLDPKSAREAGFEYHGIGR